MLQQILIRIEFYNSIVRAVSLPQHAFVDGLCLQSAVNHQKVKCVTLRGSIRTAHYKFGRKRSVGISRDFPSILSTPYYLRNR